MSNAYWDEKKPKKLIVLPGQDLPQSNNPWDVLVLEKLGERIGVQKKSFTMPGIPTLSVVCTYDYVYKETKGISFPRPIPSGLKGRDINVKLLLTTKAEYDKFLEFIKETNLTTGNLSDRYNIIHPIAQAFNIKDAYLKQLSAPMPNAKDGWTVEMTLIEIGTPKQLSTRSELTPSKTPEPSIKPPNKD